MHHYVYGSRPKDTEFSVWSMSGDSFFNGQKKERRCPSMERAEDIARTLASQEGTVAIPYSVYNWLNYRYLDGESVMITRRPVGSMHTISLATTGRYSTHIVTLNTLEQALQAVDLISELFSGRRKEPETPQFVQYPVPVLTPKEDLTGIKRLPDGRHRGYIRTFYQNIWKDGELIECNPVDLIEIPKPFYRGTGTVCDIQVPRKKKVRRQGDDGVFRTTYENTGVFDTLEVALTTTREVKQPEPGYIYCEYRLR